MKSLSVILMALVALVMFVPAAHAQNKSLLDPIRLGVGASVNREWSIGTNAAGTDANWRVGVPLSWQITSPNDPNVKHPLSLTGLIDYRLMSTDPLNTVDKWRFHLGVTWALKVAGQSL